MTIVVYYTANKMFLNCRCNHCIHNIMHNAASTMRLIIEGSFPCLYCLYCRPDLGLTFDINFRSSMCLKCDGTQSRKFIYFWVNFSNAHLMPECQVNHFFSLEKKPPSSFSCCLLSWCSSVLVAFEPEVLLTPPANNTDCTRQYCIFVLRGISNFPVLIFLCSFILISR